MSSCYVRELKELENCGGSVGIWASFFIFPSIFCGLRRWVLMESTAPEVDIMNSFLVMCRERCHIPRVIGPTNQGFRYHC